MTIEIEKPELAALIHAWMKSGAFPSVEDALIEALKVSLRPATEQTGRAHVKSSQMGSDLVEAMQASPYKEICLTADSLRAPVRDVLL